MAGIVVIVNIWLPVVSLPENLEECLIKDGFNCSCEISFKIDHSQVVAHIHIMWISQSQSEDVLIRFYSSGDPGSEINSLKMHMYVLIKILLIASFFVVAFFLNFLIYSE